MTSREKALQRYQAKRARIEAEINSHYELVKSGKLTAQQNEIVESDEYQNEWITQQTRCFDRRGEEVSPHLTLRYRELTMRIVFFSMDIEFAIHHFESAAIRCWSN